jgi:hypothetical protein
VEASTGSFGGEIVGEDEIGGFAGVVEADEAVVGVGADDAGLGEFQARQALGFVGGDAPGGEGQQADAVTAVDQEFLDALEADLAVGGLLADESGLGEGGRRKGHRQDRQVSDCEGHYGRESAVARGPGLEYNRGTN